MFGGRKISWIARALVGQKVFRRERVLVIRTILQFEALWSCNVVVRIAR
jgi:hypothetical protein